MPNSNTTITSGPDLSARWNTWSDGGLPTSISPRLAHLHIYTAEDLSYLDSLAAELQDLLEHHHPIFAVDRFLAAAATHAESCDRRAALRVFERLSQLGVDPLPWSSLPHPDPNARRRVLTSIEQGLVRHCALPVAQRAGVVGLLDSGASSGELGGLHAPAFTFTGPLVEIADLPGTCRDARSGYPEAQPRGAQIATWARPSLTSLVGAAGARPVLYSGQSTDQGKVQSAMLMVVRTVLRDAGVSGDPTVQPLSIRNTFGRAHYDASKDLLATAAMLGHDDLMTVAREIGIRNHPPVSKRRKTTT